MEPYAAVEQRLKALNRFEHEWDQWRAALARDALWADLDERVAEPGRTQLKQVAEQLERGDEGMRNMRVARDETRAALEDARRMLTLNMIGPEDIEAHERKLLAPIDGMLESGPMMLGVIKEVLGELRKAQGLPPFEPQGPDEDERPLLN